MNPMIEAPRDGTEILAYHIDGGNYHPVSWCTWKVLNSLQDYKQSDCDYEGWIDYPSKPNST